MPRKIGEWLRDVSPKMSDSRIPKRVMASHTELAYGPKCFQKTSPDQITNDSMPNDRFQNTSQLTKNPHPMRHSFGSVGVFVVVS